MLPPLLRSGWPEWTADVTVIAVGSLRGSPGATLLALDLARFLDGDALLIEADPDGGCLAARLDLAIRPGLTELAGAARAGIAAEDLWRFAQPTDHGVAVIVAHPAAEPVQAALRAAVHHVGSALAGLGRHVVIDVGRIRPGSPALGFAALADRLLVASDNSAEAVVAITHRAQLLHGLTDPLVVLSAAKPYGIDEIASVTGQPVWGVMPVANGRRNIRRRSRALVDLIAACTPARTVIETGVPA
ncbi:MAG: hypothetical protein ABIR32_17795 [Ilumatobacteraceae bacterium]